MELSQKRTLATGKFRVDGERPMGGGMDLVVPAIYNCGDDENRSERRIEITARMYFTLTGKNCIKRVVTDLGFYEIRTALLI